jgi:hypothetical protein
MKTMASDGLLSIYAAIVSTSALLFNFKNWVDSGVKLKTVADGQCKDVRRRRI